MPGPGGIPGCLLWLRTDDLSALANNDPVPSWPDRSGNGDDVAEGVAAAQPLLKTNRINGHRGVLFDGVDDRLLRTDALGLDGNPGLTVFLVARWISGSGDGGFEVGDNAGGTRKVVRLGMDATTSGFFHNNGSFTFPAAGSAWKVRTYVRSDSGQIQDGRYFENRVEKTSSGSSNPTDVVELDNERTLLGGGFFGGAYFYRNIEFAEILVYGRELSAAERATLELYLMARYIPGTGPAAVPTPVSGKAMVSVGGVERNAVLGSVVARHQAFSPSTLSLTLLDPAGNITVTERTEIVVYRHNGTGAVPVFGGHVMAATTRVIKDSASRRHDVYARGYDYLAEKRLIRGVYEGTTVAAVVNDILEVYLTPEFVRAGLPPSGFGYSPPSTAITRIEFPVGTTVAGALDQIAELAGGYFWYIRPYVDTAGNLTRCLFFTAPGGIVSSVTLSAATVDYNAAEVERASPEYRNRQHLAGGASTGSRVETFAGDGERRSFGVGFPLLRAPTVETNTGAGYVARTVGIKGVDVGKAWYWNEGSEFVTQDDAGTVLGATHKIRLTYEGRTELALIVSDDAEIAANAVREGSSGLVERADRMEWIAGVTEGGEIGAAKLDYWARPTRRLRCVYRSNVTDAYAVGYAYNASLASLGLPASMVVESNEIRVLPRTQDLEHRIVVVDGAALSSWEVRLRARRDLPGHTVNLVDVVV